MAYKAIVSFGNRLFTEAEKNGVFTYIKDQMATGATDGVSWGISKVGLDNGLTHGDLRVWEWQTQDQANAFVSYCNTFTPGPVWAEVIVPGQPFVIQEPTGPIPTPPGPSA